MKLKEILDRHTWAEIANRMPDLYPDQEKNLEGYEVVFNELLSLTPATTEMRICVEEYIDDYDGHPYTSITGFDGTTWGEHEPEFDFTEEQANRELPFSLSWTPWEEWLGMDVEAEGYEEVDVICHALYDMTFYGYTQSDIQDVANEVLETCDKAMDELLGEEEADDAE